MLRQREIDAGVTYLSNEPIGDVSAIPIYREEYLLLTTADRVRSGTQIASRGRRPRSALCAFLAATCRAAASSTAFFGGSASRQRRVLETDSLSALIAHVRVGQWASIVPNSALESVELTDTLRAIPIVEPEVFHTIGLVVSDRYPVQPAVTSLIEEARARAPHGLLPAA